MAAVSSCCKVSCQVRQRARPASTIAIRLFKVTGHIVGTDLETGRRAQATVGLYAPNFMGYTRATMVGTMGYNSERRS